jgi:hypothetical protein
MAALVHVTTPPVPSSLLVAAPGDPQETPEQRHARRLAWGKKWGQLVKAEAERLKGETK